jgi:hypothetical protein
VRPVSMRRHRRQSFAGRGSPVYFTNEFAVVRSVAKTISPVDGKSQTCPTKALHQDGEHAFGALHRVVERA